MRYRVNAKERRLGVILSIREYNKLLEAVEELDSIPVYDTAKASGDVAVPFEQAIDEIERLQ